MAFELNEVFWLDLLARMEARQVVPVIGPGAITFGVDDQLLYPDLARALAGKIGTKEPPLDLQTVVTEVRKNSKDLGDVYLLLHTLLVGDRRTPGPTLERLASLDRCRLFLTTGFDSLLARSFPAPPAGTAPVIRAMVSSGVVDDIPAPAHELKDPCIVHLLGRADANRDFAVWDEDALHYLLYLQELLPNLPNLQNALRKKHLLLLGLSYPDWLLRFFVHAVKGERLSRLDRAALSIAESLPEDQRSETVAYFSGLNQDLRLFHCDPRQFVPELVRLWKERAALLEETPEPTPPPAKPDLLEPGYVFLSYASQDRATVEHMAGQLRNSRIPFWFDTEELQLGDQWDAVIGKSISEDCALFLSVISQNSEKRTEGYFIKERKLAIQRTDLIADNVTFYLPVRVDNGVIIPPNEPRGTKKFQGVRAPDGNLSQELLRRICKLLHDWHAQRGLPMPQCQL